MKKVLLLVIVLSLLGFNAQGADLKIAYVDFNKALNESDNGKRATKILEEMIKNKKSILLEKEKELKKLEDELKKQSSVLTPESRKDKEDQLSKLFRDYKRMGKDFQEEIQKKEAELTQEIQNDLLKIVNKIGEEEGYTILFERGASGTLYSQNKLDITQKVIKKYNDITKSKK